MNRLLLFSDRLVPEVGASSVAVDDKLADVKDKDSQLLDYIYALNPVTQLPQGDLAVYLGDKANPQIKSFIQANLMNEISEGKSEMHLSQDVLNKFREHISDDDIAAFSRNHGETKEEYADRMKLFFLEEKQKRFASAREKRNKEFLDSLHDS